MKKTLIMAGVALGFLAGNAAMACDLKAFPFGKDMPEVTQYYGLDDVRTGDYAKMDTRAQRVCDTLPPTAVMHFVFVKGKLAEVAIENHRGEGELLTLAEKHYGKAENRPPEGHPKRDHFHQTWVDGNKPVVLYGSRPVEKGVSEYLKLSSREYRDALGKATAEKGPIVKSTGAR